MGCGASTAKPPSAEATRYGPIIKGHEGAIKTLFKKIDANGDGVLVASELKDVVSKYTGEAFDEDQFFDWFDTHISGGTRKPKIMEDKSVPTTRLLNLDEFGWYLANLCEGLDEPTKAMSGVIQKFEQNISGLEATRYGDIIAGHEADIEALFKKIDADSNGFLIVSELKNVVAKYTGEAFDEAQFFGWFDVHGEGSGEPDSQLDLKEFGWYVADIAEGFPNPKEAVAAIIKDLTPS